MIERTTKQRSIGAPLALGLAFATILAAMACGGTSSVGGASGARPAPTAAGSSSAGGADTTQTCLAVKDLAHACFDASEPGLACEQVATLARARAAEGGLDASVQEALAGICARACIARGSGASWAEIDAQLDCARR